jgi:hypothetical protein
MRSIAGRAFSHGLLALVLFAVGCAKDKGTGLLILTISADPANPPSPATSVVLTVAGGKPRTYSGAFPPAGGGDLVLGYADMPASDSPVTLSVQAYSGQCLVASGTRQVTIKAGEKTTSDIVLVKSATACSDGGVPGGSTEAGAAGVDSARDGSDGAPLDATGIDGTQDAPQASAAEGGSGSDGRDAGADVTDAPLPQETGQDVPLGSGGVTGTGGSAGAGGGAGTGGAISAGGATGTGGVIAGGGTIGTGGTIATGGIVGTGGVVVTGGIIGTGGAGTGGIVGTGGAGTGGIVGTGGAGTGGIVGTGGAGTGGTTACPDPCTVGTTCLSSTSLQTCAVVSGCAVATTQTCSTGQVCERYAQASCEDPNWNQWPLPNSQVDVSAGAPNLASYTDNGNGTVTDNVTGLMWQQAVQEAMYYTWAQAVAYCPTLTLAGHSDWRLPTRIELLSIVDFGRDPAINTTYFLSTSTYLWSSSPLARSSSNAWYVNFSDGNSYYVDVSGTNNFRCVR